jgi:hypothetical protein
VEDREELCNRKDRRNRKRDTEENGCGDKNSIGSGESVHSQINLQMNTFTGTNSAAQSSPETSEHRFSLFRVFSDAKRGCYTEQQWNEVQWQFRGRKSSSFPCLPLCENEISSAVFRPNMAVMVAFCSVGSMSQVGTRNLLQS